jgi:PIN domain nuclease of toxin-antitoxin system
VSIVLDTHAVISYLHRPGSLSSNALQAIHSSIGKSLPLFISSISLVETVYLVEGGRLQIEALQRLTNATKSSKSGILVQPLDEAVAETMRSVPRASVPDMPDRIIAATALHLGLRLVTRDRRLHAAGIETVW